MKDGSLNDAFVKVSHNEIRFIQILQKKCQCLGQHRQEVPGINLIREDTRKLGLKLDTMISVFCLITEMW